MNIHRLSTHAALALLMCVGALACRAADDTPPTAAPAATPPPASVAPPGSATTAASPVTTKPAAASAGAAAPDSSAPAGATAKCKDGSYSKSRHRAGTCSSHGGVAQWLGAAPPSTP